jgi:hypothetical protein
MSNYTGNIHQPQELTVKQLKDQELVTLHKIILIDYIKSNLRWDSFKKEKVFKKYDQEVDRDNIRCYYNYNVGIFLIALLQDKLPTIANYCYIGWDEEDEEEDND